MACGIYKITNTINQKCYIGQSINIHSRWSDEKERAFNVNANEYNKTLSKAIRKYGIEAFSFEIIEECEPFELDEKEVYYISLYDSYYNGYNETLGGQAGKGICIKISKENLLEIYNLLINTSMPQKEIAERFSVGQDVISTINHGKSRRLNGYTYPLRNNSKIIAYCCDCGAVLKSTNAKRCMSCEKKRSRKVEWPSREELKSLIRTTPFTTLGKQFGVSDKAISKWCDFYNLPSKKSLIKQYDDKSWEKI